MEAVQRENEELKEVLSAVQIDLESKTEVTVHHRPCHYMAKFCCGVAIFSSFMLITFIGTSAKNNGCNFARTRNRRANIKTAGNR